MAGSSQGKVLVGRVGHMGCKEYMVQLMIPWKLMIQNVHPKAPLHPCRLQDVPILVADAADSSALGEVLKQTQVVLKEYVGLWWSVCWSPATDSFPMTVDGHAVDKL